jgi:tetratricopeptide (TPR) repeat protein
MGRAASEKWLAASSRLIILLASFTLVIFPLRAQLFFGNPYDAGVGAQRPGGNPWGIPGPIEPGDMRMDAVPAPTAPASTVSGDVLRHPLSGRALRLLRKARRIANLGDHAAAIAVLKEGLVRQPAATPYIENQLGAEYLETHQFDSAVASFAEAARIMPRDTAVHSNYGLSLAVVGQFDLAEKELNQAIALDHTNEKAKSILDAMRIVERTASSPAR